MPLLPPHTGSMSAMNELPIVALTDRIEDQSSLDTIALRARSVIDRVPRRLRDLLHGVPIGHPAHPAAVLVPAGAWISAAVLDLVPGASRAAQTLVGVGVLSALPSAASGWADWATLRTRQQRVGLVHAATNVAAVGLYTASWLQRRRGNELAGKVLGMTGLALVSAGGYLGGHLAYRTDAELILTPDTEALPGQV